VERSEAEAILDGDRETAIGLLMRIGELVEANRRLEARVAELEDRVNRSSRNSSLPPSADPPSLPPRSSKGSGRKPGGQSGHPGSTRMLVGPDRVDEAHDHWPARCRGCDRVFELVDWVEQGTAGVHQVCELPLLAVTITEHRLHTVSCVCGKTTRASLPSGVTGSAFGPRLQAAVATLATRQRLSRRQTAETVQELFGCPVSIGAVDAIIGRVADAVAKPYDELRAQLPKEPVVYADETGWALAGKPHWAAIHARRVVTCAASAASPGSTSPPAASAPAARSCRPACPTPVPGNRCGGSPAPASAPARFAITTFSSHVVTNARYFWRLS
jgi:transposase